MRRHALTIVRLVGKRKMLFSFMWCIACLKNATTDSHPKTDWEAKTTESSPIESDPHFQLHPEDQNSENMGGLLTLRLTPLIHMSIQNSNNKSTTNLFGHLRLHHITKLVIQSTTPPSLQVGSNPPASYHSLTSHRSTRADRFLGVKHGTVTAYEV